MEARSNFTVQSMAGQRHLGTCIVIDFAGTIYRRYDFIGLIRAVLLLTKGRGGLVSQAVRGHLLRHGELAQDTSHWNLCDVVRHACQV